MQLLIIGTLDGQIGAASSIAIKRGAKVLQARDIDQGLQILRDGAGPDLIMIDVKEEIKRLVDSLEAERMHISVVACGVENDARAAVQSIKDGAKEYIPLPPDPEVIAAVLAAITEEANAVIYRDEAMANVLKMAEQVAPSDASILVTGESGTGKEVVAHFIHRKSRRADKRFVAVNCAAIPENLLESELFGHEKGAFTGAVARRIGKFEEADGGTLLLDEISEMDPRLQAKLLRVLQEKEIDRIGGNKPVKVDVRIIATSNRNMEKEVKAGTFREDLYFRLNVVNVRMPALRERKGDIAPLAAHFAKRFTEMNGLPERKLSEDAVAKLTAHSWPGNVRELENTLHRAVLIATGPQIDIDAIVVNQTGDDTEETAAAVGNGPGMGAMVGRTVADVERDLIIDTLKHCLGNRTHAANILGISIRTLRNKLKTYMDEGYSVPAPGTGDQASP